MRTETETQIETLEDIFLSFENGNYTQTKEEINEALEAGLDFSVALDIDTDYTAHRMALNNRFKSFVWVQISKYLASNEASDEAKSNVNGW
jgi:hypothetical protein